MDVSPESNALMSKLVSLPVLCGVLGALFLATVGCQAQRSRLVAPVSPSPIALSSPSPSPSAQPKTDWTTQFKQAQDKAASAATHAQSATSKEDWELVVSRWQQAVDLLRAVPATSPLQAMAQPKLAEYQRHLAYAQKQLQKANSSLAGLPPIAKSNATLDSLPVRSTKAGHLFRVPIKFRAGGTPVIDVTFNGYYTYAMIVDTGASSTVITTQMASEMGVKEIGRTTFSTANGTMSAPLGYVASVGVGDAVVNDIIVSINPTMRDFGLLGHDFFSNYDVTIKQDVVEFRQRS